MFRRTQMPDVFDRLEREASDDFRLLEELGPVHFGTEHLVDLHAQARERLALFKVRQRLGMLIGGTGAGWALLAALFNLAGWNWLAIIALGAAALSFAVFLFIVFWQKKRFESRGELEYAQRLIEEELRLRAQKRREANR